MADFIFDGTSKVIKEPVGFGNTSFDVGRDVYSAWKRWVQIGNAQYDAAFIVEGGTPIGATGLFTGTTFLLTNGWKIMAADHDHQLSLSGNLFSDDGVVSTPNPLGQSTVAISSSVNAQGVSTTSANTISQQDKEDIASLVWSQLSADNNTPNTMGQVLNSTTTGEVDPQQLADAVWNALGADHNVNESMGVFLKEVLSKITEIHKLEKLDQNHEVTFTQSSIVVDDIRINLLGDGENITIARRE